MEKRFGRDFFAEIADDLQKSELFDRAMQSARAGTANRYFEASAVIITLTGRVPVTSMMDCRALRNARCGPF